MFDQIYDSIHETALNQSEYVLGNHFTDNAKMSLEDYGIFFLFKDGKTLQSDIESFYMYFKPDEEIISKQAVSSQRMYIKPQFFKDISSNYLKNIDYPNNPNLKRFKDLIILAGDGSDYELPDFPEVRQEFNIISTPKYTKPCMGKFSGVMDVLNGFIIDGIMGNYKEGELPLMQQNLNNIENNFNRGDCVFTFDRLYGAMELYARIIQMGQYFVVRLKHNNYKNERSGITSPDSPIQLKITSDRLKKFKNPVLREIWSQKQTMDLRILKIKLKNGVTETLLTNIPKEQMKLGEIKFIYKQRWGIETNYNILKNRFYIENYSSKKRIGIEQDIYSKFLIFNIFHYLRLAFDRIINLKKRRHSINAVYKVDQSNLIRNINKFILRILWPPSDKIKKICIKNFIKSSTRSPNKVKKSTNPPRGKTLMRKFNIQYAFT